jgi:hypothetical protein
MLLPVSRFLAATAVAAFAFVVTAELALGRSRHWVKMKNPACAAGEAGGGRGLDEVTRRTCCRSIIFPQGIPIPTQPNSQHNRGHTFCGVGFGAVWEAPP